MSTFVPVRAARLYGLMRDCDARAAGAEASAERLSWGRAYIALLDRACGALGEDGSPIHTAAALAFADLCEISRILARDGGDVHFGDRETTTAGCRAETPGVTYSCQPDGSWTIDIHVANRRWGDVAVGPVFRLVLRDGAELDVTRPSGRRYDEDSLILTPVRRTGAELIARSLRRP